MLSVKNSGGATTQEKTITSSRSTQTVTPDAGKLLSKVTVNGLAPTGTFTPSSNGSAIDMGASSNYRYVNTTTVYNSGKAAYSSLSKQAAAGDYGSASIDTSWLCSASTGLVIESIFAQGTISSVGASGGTQVGVIDHRTYGSNASYSPGVYLRVAKAAKNTTYRITATGSDQLGGFIAYCN